jgi:dihydroorotase
MLTEVNRGRLTLSHYVRTACEAPARAFGLYPRKGALLAGADADLVVVDMTRRDTITNARAGFPRRETPFAGLLTIGSPVMTMVRGEIIVEEGRVCAEFGRGRSVRPSR